MQFVAVQLDITWEQPEENHARARRLVELAEAKPGSLIVLPEMFATGFSMDVPVVAEEQSGATSQFLQDLARQRRCFVVGGVATRAASGRGRNEAIAFGPDGQIVARYAKLHPFTLGGESKHFEAGGRVVTFRCGPFIAAPFVCYDLRFPEAFRLSAREGANLLLVIANWPISRGEHWLTLLRARAIENQAFVVGVNRTGSDPNVRYGGRSVVVDPAGTIRADAGDAEGTLAFDLQLAELEEHRRRFPFLPDMREDLMPRRG